MAHVDWWSWKCARCDFKARDKYTVNPQQSVAEAIVRCHIQEHERAEVEPAVAAVPHQEPPA
jgi:hypothetical protein